MYSEIYCGLSCVRKRVNETVYIFAGIFAHYPFIKRDTIFDELFVKLNFALCCYVFLVPYFARCVSDNRFDVFNSVFWGNGKKRVGITGNRQKSVLNCVLGVMFIVKMLKGNVIEIRNILLINLR